MSITVADLFCGTGGFSHGFEQAGDFKVVLGVEIRPQSIETFSANHEDALAICDDIHNVRVSDVAEKLGRGSKSIDVLVGGPPCQGFSSIRPFRSINENDRRNNLFEQFTFFVEFFKPRIVVFENVVGLTHHKKGQTLASIEKAFQQLGYATTKAILHAVQFGVPQKRERVIILARRGKKPPVLPEPQYAGSGSGGSNGRTLFDTELPPPLTLTDAICDLPPIESGGEATKYLPRKMASAYARDRRKKLTELTMHSATKHGEKMLAIIRKAGKNRWALPEGMTTSGFSSCYSRLDADEPSTTITVNFVHPASNRCIHPVQDRALTPREGARIQSFDDDYKFCGSRTHVVKQIGEAVPPLLGKAIAKSILEQL